MCQTIAGFLNLARTVPKKNLFVHYCEKHIVDVGTLERWNTFGVPFFSSMFLSYEFNPDVGGPTL